MDVTVALSGGKALCGMTLDVPTGGALPDVIVLGDWIFAYDDISDKGLATYRPVTAYVTNSATGKGVPLTRTRHHDEAAGNE